MKKIILILSGLIIISLIFGCTTTGQLAKNDVNELKVLSQNYELKINEKNNTINELNTKIIELQESNEYLKTVKSNAEKKESELQDIYNKAWNDLTTCYWANVCSYNPDGCVEHYKDVWVGWTGLEIYRYYSNECDKIDRDWDTYVKYDTTGD